MSPFILLFLNTVSPYYSHFVSHDRHGLLPRYTVRDYLIVKSALSAWHVMRSQVCTGVAELDLEVAGKVLRKQLAAHRRLAAPFKWFHGRLLNLVYGLLVIQLLALSCTMVIVLLNSKGCSNGFTFLESQEDYDMSWAQPLCEKINGLLLVTV